MDETTEEAGDGRKMALVFKRPKRRYRRVDGRNEAYESFQYCAGWVRDDGTWFVTEIPDDVLDEGGYDTDDTPF